jgi:hypothetical protein
MAGARVSGVCHTWQRVDELTPLPADEGCCLVGAVRSAPQQVPAAAGAADRVGVRVICLPGCSASTQEPHGRTCPAPASPCAPAWARPWRCRPCARRPLPATCAAPGTRPRSLESASHRARTCDGGGGCDSTERLWGWLRRRVHTDPPTHPPEVRDGSHVWWQGRPDGWGLAEAAGGAVMRTRCRQQS